MCRNALMYVHTCAYGIIGCHPPNPRGPFSGLGSAEPWLCFGAFLFHCGPSAQNLHSAASIPACAGSL